MGKSLKIIDSLELIKTFDKIIFKWFWYIYFYNIKIKYFIKSIKKNEPSHKVNNKI